MKYLRELLHQYLKSIHPRVYFQEAPDNAQFPYLVYDFTQIINDGEGFETIAIDIDGWDMPSKGDTTELEMLMHTVNKALDKQTLTSTIVNPIAWNEANFPWKISVPWNMVQSYEGLAVTFYLDRKLSLRDDNKNIRRRKYIYEARLFGRS